MPFKSRAKQGYLYVHEPKIAAKFASETSKAQYENMPEHVKRKAKAMRKASEGE